MKNSVQLAFNAVFAVAVAVLFYLHFSARPAAVPAKKAPATPAAVPAAPEEPEAPAAPEVAPADTNKIAYVESGKLLDGYQAMKDARKNFEAKAKRWESQNQSMVQSFQAAVQQYQKQGESMTTEQRAATEQKLQAQQMQVAQSQEKLQRQAQEEEAKMTQAVLDRANKQVEKYGKAHGYRLILSGSVAYGRKDLDITAPVLKFLNAEYAKK